MERARHAVVAALLLAFVGCKGDVDQAAPPDDPMLRDLRTFEVVLRASTPLGHDPPSDRRLGPDPYVVAPFGAGFVGLARGAAEIVVFDAAVHELARRAVAPGSDALAVRPDGVILVGAEGSLELQAFLFAPTTRMLEELDPVGLPAAHGGGGVRALAVHESGAAYAVDAQADALYVVSPEGRASLPIPVAAGPIRLAVTRRWLVVASLVGHALSVFRLTAEGEVEGGPDVLPIDGPFWGVAAEERGGALRIAAGGAEDHPLDRTSGSFGDIDSFVHLYSEGADHALVREKALNVSELGVVTPKALAFDPSGALLVTGYGSAVAVKVGVDRSTRTFDLPPGSASIALLTDGSFVVANPLLDRWVHVRGRGEFEVDEVDERPIGPRTERSRIGEALVFTTLMAPWQSSEGERSRFTCETCHFEGLGDGRIHATGRGTTTATTKPLHGLFDNEPHFTRALDDDMATMILNEFRVAASRSDHDAVFSLAEAEVAPSFPGGLGWLRLERPIPDYDAMDLRRALLEFLRDFSPRENPRARARASFTSEEAHGAAVFERACATCHAPRLRASDPSTEVPFADWETEIFAGGHIVWGRAGYEQTGIEPYVHEDGARPSSLRRISQKRPYFTNGSSATLDDVLRRFRVLDAGGGMERSMHSASEGRALEPGDRASLEAFLRLL